MGNFRQLRASPYAHHGIIALKTFSEVKPSLAFVNEAVLYYHCMGKKLTPKQNAFCDYHIALGEENGAEAARRAKYAHSNAAATASKLLKLPHIQDALKRKRTALEEVSTISMDYLTGKLREIVEGLDKKAKTSDRISSLTLLARLHSLLREKGDGKQIVNLIQIGLDDKPVVKLPEEVTIELKPKQ